MVGLIALIPMLAGRRRRALAAWDQPMADAEQAARWLQDRAVPVVLAEPDPGRSAAAWSATRPRFLDLDEQLTDLARTAPDPERRDMAGSLRAALADLAAALDERSVASSAQDWSTAGMHVELARERLERRLRHEPLVPPGSPTSPADQPSTVTLADGTAVIPQPSAQPPTSQQPPSAQSSSAQPPVAQPPVAQPPASQPPASQQPPSPPPTGPGGSSSEGEAGSGGGRHVRRHDE
ncbi:MAG TPA: hypothetical protein VMT69_13460 [Kineosporiaceae bacterium]|nr:hypothetical protein [Kineosporiaceae bacterium]